MPKSTRPKPPRKPRRDFPLFPHRSGQWCKKVSWNGKQRAFYFGVWSDPVAAERRWDAEKEYLLAGRLPPSRTTVPAVQTEAGEFCTVQRLCNEYLRFKEQLVASGELKNSTFVQYFQTCALLTGFFGKERRADDIRTEEWAELRSTLARKVKAATLNGYINRIRGIFKFGTEQRLLKQRMEFGQGFKRPSAKKLRQEKQAGGRKLFTRDEVLRLLEAADPQLKAMILLAVNTGLGNNDVALLRHGHIDGDWLDYPRPKTATDRRAKLWPETLQAIEAIDRRQPRDPKHADLVFLTRTGRPWVHSREKEPGKVETTVYTNAVALRFGKLLRDLNINGRRGLGFYGLRHTYRTVADGALDQPAIALTMGHVDSSMAGQYREEIADERLERVSAHVHDWLFGE